MIDFEKCRRALKALELHHLTLGSVESITGGLFASSLTTIPGSSEVFKGAYVTYSSELKEKLLGVPSELIEKHGVVSQEVANEMAIRGRKKLGVDVAVAFTGNAGPTAEPGRAGVGVVCMAISTKYGLIELQQEFQGSRQEDRERSVDMMLDQLIAIFS